MVTHNPIPCFRGVQEGKKLTTHWKPNWTFIVSYIWVYASSSQYDWPYNNKQHSKLL